LLLRQQLRTISLPHGLQIVVLVAALALGLAEPLLCILHCELWMPAAHAGHQHAAHAEADGAGCATLGVPGQGHSAHYVPPSPVHEMALLLAPSLLGLTMHHPRPRARAASLLSRAQAPPLRPPILLTA
jgi:hypothetical protein